VRIAMGARFDKWLARPSTLHFLRRLVGPEHATIPTKPQRWTATARTNANCYGTVATTQWVPPTQALDKMTYVAAAAAALETFLEQRARVAKELGLHASEENDDAAISSVEAYGLHPSSTSYSDLLYSETRVRTVSQSRDLLIDKPENFANLEAWCRILQHRERIDGFHGVVDVWTGMRDRGIDLPVDGNLADTFWTILIQAAVKSKIKASHKKLLEEVIRHAEHLRASGRGHYRRLHTVLIGRFLRNPPYIPKGDGNLRNVGHEYTWHRRIRDAGFCDAHSLADLTMDVVKSSNPNTAFARWRRMYQDSESRDLYDACMPTVLSHAADNVQLIASWHMLFVSNGDMPGPELASTRAVQYLSSKLQSGGEGGGVPIHTYIHPEELRQITKVDWDAAVHSTSPLLSRASMNGLVGDVHGIKPKAISDQFCARMFATKTFSLETIIRGLALLGTDGLGPMALRELAIRAASPEVLEEKLADIRDAGMLISPSVYGHILNKVVADKQHELFQTLLESDQHPESYEDQHTQEMLLGNFLQAEQWSLAYLTLIGLSHRGNLRSDRAWNRLLQHYVKAENHLEIVRIYNHMFSEHLAISSRTLNFLGKYLLPTRSPSKRPMVASNSPMGHFKSLNLVANAHMYAASSGQYVSPERWIELLKRFGMSGDVDGLTHFAPWLAQHYARDATVNYRGLYKVYRPTDAIRSKVFNPVMLRALVIWGFRSAGMRDKLRPWTRNPRISVDDKLRTELWARGLDLLLQLKRLGVRAKTEDVRRAMIEILWPLFGPGCSKRPSNLAIMQRNHLSLARYVEHANKVWGKPIFDVLPGPFQDGSPDGRAAKEALLLVSVFGKHRLADQKTGTWVDVEAWATARAEGVWREPTSTFAGRNRDWKRNEFRFLDLLGSRRKRQLVNSRRSPVSRSALTNPGGSSDAAQPSSPHLPSVQSSTREEP
jgi:hypothetical protein